MERRTRMGSGAGQGRGVGGSPQPSHPIPSHPRPSLHPSSPGPASRRGEGWGGCAHPAARRLARRGARHADPLLPRRGARPGLGRGRGGEPGGLGPTGAWTSPGAAARTPPPRGAREVGGRARALAPPSLLPSWWIRSTSCPRGPAAAARPAPPRSHGPGSTSTPLAPPRLGDYPGGGGRASRPLAVRPADLVSRPAPPASASHTARPCLRPSAGRPASRSLAPASIPRAGDLSGLCHRHRCFIPSDSPGLALDPPLWIYS